MTENRIVLDYTNRDFGAVRAQLVGLSRGLMPEWQTVGETSDFGTLLLELYAYSADVTNYYIDRMASEAFLGTAVRRQSVLYIADMFGYTPIGQQSSVVPLIFTWEWDTQTTSVNPITYPTIEAASVLDGVVSLTIDNTAEGVNDYEIGIVAGQTIQVTNADFSSAVPAANLNGTYVVTSVTPVAGINKATITFNLSTQADTNILLDGHTPGITVTVGPVIMLNQGTRVYSNPMADGTVVNFELASRVILDSTAAPVVENTTIRRVTATGSAVEGVTVTPREIGTSLGIPNAEFIIDNPGVVDGTVQVYTIEGGQAIFWTYVNKLSLASPTQSVFTTYVDDNDYMHVVFGDGASGRVPTTNARIFVGYRFGVGAKGNELAVNSVVNLDDAQALANGVTVTNTSSPTNGSDVETTESMRVSVPKAASIKQRAVTVEDFVSLALQVKGVTKAVAYGTNYTAIYVRIASTAQSEGYKTATIVKNYIAANYATMIFDASTSLVEGQKLYLSDTGSTELNGEHTVTEVHGIGAPFTITKVKRASNIATITVESNPGFITGQIVLIENLTNDSNAFQGYKVVLSVTPLGDDTTEVTFANSGAGYGEAAATGTVPKVTSTSTATFASAETATTGVESLSGGATYLDGAMSVLVDSVESYLADKKIVGSVVYAEPVVWSDVVVKATVAVRPLFNRTAVKAAVKSAIESVFSFTNVDFGKRISKGDVYRAALDIEGVDYLTIDELYLKDINVLRGLTGIREWIPKSNVTTKQVSSNVATITVAADHKLEPGDTVIVAGVDATFDGTYTVKGVPTTKKFTYDLTTGDTGPTGDTGTVTPSAYAAGDVVLECASYYKALDANTPSSDTFTADAAHWESWTIVQDINPPPYNLPRLDPTLSTNWITGTGGLVGT